ncbi:hypothetical protein QR680_016513 [Steinernema hermaphroditum]|uniref:Metalloendopeptidase n=1 Tax=Steinernema hermaphroditum TaxID=289476 RepID=A0AA39HBG7_9BILA|nr:hypothetical protein QR680_016513 [Steinernema hermaphroditum]
MSLPNFLALTLLWICLLSPQNAEAFRLNVPRVLLPYHPTNPVSFLLEVTDPKGGCFSWRSTRPEIVAVHTVDAHPSGCSSRAVVTAVSKHAEEHSAVIFAQDTQTGTSLSCGVTVDVIKSISITTTTRILHIDAAPAKMIVEAFNREGDRFSNLGDIPFEWNFSGAEVKPLRIVPFSQSRYEAPEGIQKLENAKKKGFVILVEGYSTGSATLTAKLSESYFENISGNSIDLVVVANLILVPSSDVYIVPHSTIQYGIQLIKSGRTEPIELPSRQYYLKLSNNDVCSLKNEESTVIAEKVGQTEISLIDRNIEGKLGIKPESAHIYVVEPDTIEFTIDRGNSWYLEKDITYTISIRVLDQLGNAILIPETANFETIFPEEHFDVIEKSKNGTWFVVKATNSGKTNIQSSFVSIFGHDGQEHKINARVTGQRAVQISDPIELSPKRLILPLSSKHSSNYRFTASGGTGTYIWSSTNAHTARVDEMSGLITPYSYGSTLVEVRDGRNSLHKAEAHVYVLEPAMIKFAPSPVEAEVGRLLVLNVEIAGLLASGQYVSFSDCRAIELRYQVEDSSVFAVESNVERTPPEEGSGCTTVVLRALSSGDTKLTVFVGDHSTTIDVSAYLPLTFNQMNSKSSEFLLALGSDISVAHSGGPRPWVLDGSNYFATITSSSDLLDITQSQGTYQVFCGDRTGQAILKLTVGNKRTSTNPFPAVAVAEQIVCCSRPSRVALSFHKERVVDTSARSCPVTSHLINCNSETQLELSLFGKCEDNDSKGDDRRFDSASSVVVAWTTNADKLVSVQDVAAASEHQGKLFAVVKPNGLRGQAVIKSEVVGFKSYRSISGSVTPFEGKKKLDDSITLGFVSRPTADSSSVVLFNEPTVTGNVQVRGGSGYFVIASGYSHTILEPSLASGKDSTALEISPRGKGKANITIHDLCIRADPLIVEVEVTDLYDIAIAAPNLFVHGNQFKTRLSLNSELQRSTEAQLSDVHIHIDGCKDSTLDVQPFFETNEAEDGHKQALHYEISLTAPSPTVWNDCSLSVKNALSNRVFKVPVRIKLYADATAAHTVAGADATVAVEVAYTYIERAYNWFKEFSTMLVMVTISLAFVYFGFKNQQKQAKQWHADPNISQQGSTLSADSLANGSQQWATAHKPLFSSTPAETSLTRRFHGGYEEQSSLDRSGLLSSSGRNLAGDVLGGIYGEHSDKSARGLNLLQKVHPNFNKIHEVAKLLASHKGELEQRLKQEQEAVYQNNKEVIHKAAEKAKGPNPRPLPKDAPRSIEEINAALGLHEVLIEGDMVMSPEQAKRYLGIRDDSPSALHRSKRQAMRDALYPQNIWLNGDDAGFYYMIRNDLNNAARTRIQAAIEFWEVNTCVRFHKIEDKKDSPIRPVVTFFPGEGCYSDIGRQIDWDADSTNHIVYEEDQYISIGNGCEHIATAAHEIAHALGMFHEQSRWDRDSYVRIDETNIAVNESHNFNKYPKGANDNYGKPYDYRGLMHYKPESFAADTSKPVLYSLNPAYQLTIGAPTDELPPYGDIYEMNMQYKCYDLVASDDWQPLRVEHIVGDGQDVQGSPTTPYHCTWHVKAPEGSKIEYRVNSVGYDGNVNALCIERCFNGGVSIKGLEESWIQGAMRFCCPRQMNEVMKTASNLLVVQPWNIRKYTDFQVEYRIDPTSPKVTTTTPEEPTTTTTDEAETTTVTTEEPTTTTEATTTAAVTPAGPPVKVFNFGNYLLVATEMSFHDAEAFCESKGYKMLTLHRKGTEKIIQRILDQKNPEGGNIFWIGLHKPQGASSQYAWLDGSPLDYSNWGRRQPKPKAAEGCAAYWEPIWAEMKCEWKYASVCQRK